MSTVFELPPRLLRVTEVAQILNLARGTVYLIMDRGELPYVKIGKSRRVRPEDVARLIDEATIGERSPNLPARSRRE